MKNLFGLHGQTRELALFLAVGVMATAFNYLIFWMALDVLGFHYIFSNWTGYLAGVLLGFLLNARYTFLAGLRPSLRQAIRYLSVYLISLGLSTLILYLLVNLTGLPPKAANLAAIMQSTTTNYLGCKFWVFRKIKRKP